MELKGLSASYEASYEELRILPSAANYSYRGGTNSIQYVFFPLLPNTEKASTQFNINFRVTELIVPVLLYGADTWTLLSTD